MNCIQFIYTYIICINMYKYSEKAFAVVGPRLWN